MLAEVFGSQWKGETLKKIPALKDSTLPAIMFP